MEDYTIALLVLIALVAAGLLFALHVWGAKMGACYKALFAIRADPRSRARHRRRNAPDEISHS